MSAAPPKYVFENGVMKMNPAFAAYNAAAAGTAGPAPAYGAPPTAHQPIAVVCSMADAQSYGGMGGQPFQMSSSTTMAMAEMKSPAYKEYFQVSSEHDMFEGLSNYFVQYEVPMGLLAKVLELRNYRINLLVDDSGSMMSTTDVTFREGTSYVRGANPPEKFMTRMQEAENRLHIMLDILSYVPTKGIKMTFMNTDETLVFEQQGRSPETFQAEAHSRLSHTFASLRFGATPTMKILTNSLKDAAAHPEHPTSHYLLTDGVPSDCSVSNLSAAIRVRADPSRNPVTLISCTNVDSECEWMKTVEESASFCSEVDDYGDEAREVKKDQGDAFPYTKGLWLLSNLVASISPNDLDALDEDVPLTKFTLDELMGRVHTPEEYQYYFSMNPHGRKYSHLQHRFATENVHARTIVPRVARARGQNGNNDGCCGIM